MKEAGLSNIPATFSDVEQPDASVVLLFFFVLNGLGSSVVW